jgi:hypothetical protein
MKEIKELLVITKRLREKYILQKKNFTLDGKLVGDIGEVLCAEKYGLELYDENAVKHDGKEIATGREVQIKSSFKYYSYFPYKHVPDYFLSINISSEGEIEELFNGPGQYILDHYVKERNLKPYNKTYYTLSRGILQKLNNLVPDSEKIQIKK